jgi:hypothetical protein
MSDDDYRRDLLDNDGRELPPMLTTEGAQRRIKIRELLGEVYLPEGVDIWLAATHKSGPLQGRCPNELIAAGKSGLVLAEAERLAGGAFA